MGIICTPCAISLNAPLGARCFLTSPQQSQTIPGVVLNAPFGARCFLTVKAYGGGVSEDKS